MPGDLVAEKSGLNRPIEHRSKRIVRSYRLALTTTEPNPQLARAQRLQLVLFVEPDHHCSLREIWVQPDDIYEFGVEGWSVRDLSATQFPRLKTAVAPEPMPPSPCRSHCKLASTWSSSTSAHHGGFAFRVWCTTAWAAPSGHGYLRSRPSAIRCTPPPWSTDRRRMTSPRSVVVAHRQGRPNWAPHLHPRPRLHDRAMPSEQAPYAALHP